MTTSNPQGKTEGGATAEPVADTGATPERAAVEHEGCDCVQRFDERLREHNTTLVSTLFGKPPRVLIQTCKLHEKVRGKPVSVIASFCPFCGQSYSREMPADGATKRQAPAQATSLG